MLTCVLIKDFLLQVTCQREHIDNSQADAIVVDRDHRTSRVVACSAKLREVGIKYGMSERDAFALCPESQILVHDAESIGLAYQRMLETLLTFTPKLEATRLGLIYLDLGKAEPLETANSIRDSLSDAMGLVPSVGHASSRFVSHVAALHCRPGRQRCIEMGEEVTFLADQSITCLPVSQESIRRLRLLGLNTLGKLAQIPVEDLVNQFGKEGALISELVRGIDKTPLTIYHPLIPLERTLEFDPALSNREAVMHQVTNLATMLFHEAQQSYRRYPHADLMFDFQGRENISRRIPLRLLLDDVDRWVRCFSSKLETLHLTDPITKIHIHLEPIPWNQEVDASSLQTELWRISDQVEQLQHLRILWEQPKWESVSLLRFMEDDLESRIPEWKAHLQDWRYAERTRLVYQPIPIEVKLNPSGDLLQIRTATGWWRVDTLLEIWKVEEHWWALQPIQRCYFQVLLESGTLFSLFQDMFTGQWYRQYQYLRQI